jgi:hypothetical protein
MTGIRHAWTFDEMSFVYRREAYVSALRGPGHRARIDKARCAPGFGARLLAGYMASEQFWMFIG